MDIGIFIYAQGLGSRWSVGTPPSLPSDYKQLIPIGDELLIQRTIRQFDGHNILLFGKHDVFGKIVSNVWELREPTGSIIDGICTTYKHLRKVGTSIIVLGDVVFENFVIQDMINCSDDKVTFFGRNSGNKFTGKKAKEIFGLVIPEQKKEVFHDILARAVNNFGLSRGSKKLWNLCDFISVEGLGPYIFRDYSETSYSDDVDSPEDWHSYGNKLIELALEDDKHYDKETIYEDCLRVY